MVNYWPLIGILIVVAGFLARLNPLGVVTAAAIATGLAAGKGLGEVIAVLGKAFNDNRYVSIIWIVLPVIGLLERYGLQSQARRLITGFRRATTGRLLIAYLLFRQLTSALGLISIAGHAQTVRPLVAPMAEAAADRNADLDDATRERVKAMAAATDNVGVFFGEDIFLAVGSILLIMGFLDSNGIQVTPFQLSVWAIPTAVLAFLIHGGRLLWLDRTLPKKIVPAGRSRGTHVSGAGEDGASLDFARDGRDGRDARDAADARDGADERDARGDGA